MHFFIHAGLLERPGQSRLVSSFPLWKSTGQILMPAVGSKDMCLLHNRNISIIFNIPRYAEIPSWNTVVQSYIPNCFSKFEIIVTALHPLLVNAKKQSIFQQAFRKIFIFLLKMNYTLEVFFVKKIKYWFLCVNFFVTWYKGFPSSSSWKLATNLVDKNPKQKWQLLGQQLLPNREPYINITLYCYIVKQVCALTCKSDWVDRLIDMLWTGARPPSSCAAYLMLGPLSWWCSSFPLPGLEKGDGNRTEKETPTVLCRSLQKLHRLGKTGQLAPSQVN